jgi:uncharacterized membrane protein HdeD (DUF308 family)
MLARILSQYWWMTLLRGLIAILFGVVLFTRPGISLLTLTLLIGLFVMADGIASVVMALGGRRENENWWLLLLAGLAGILVGVLTFINPSITALALLFYVAIWAIASGILVLATAIRLRHEIQGELWLGLNGALSILFGMLIAARPGEGALAVLWLIAAYAIAFGVTLVLLALKARSFVHRIGTAVRAQPLPGR